MMEMDLQMFTGSYTLTVYNDGHFSATTASPSSSLDANDKSTLTITPSAGYELDRIEVVTGGATVLYESEAWKVKMGNASAVVKVFGKKNNLYKVVENCYVSVNGSATELQRNMVLTYGGTGAVTGVTSDGTELSISADVIAELVKSGVLIKI